MTLIKDFFYMSMPRRGGNSSLGFVGFAFTDETARALHKALIAASWDKLGLTAKEIRLLQQFVIELQDRMIKKQMLPKEKR